MTQSPLFASLERFLVEDELAALFDYVVQQEHAFRGSEVVSNDVISENDPATRRSKVLYALGPYEGLFVRRIESFLPWAAFKLKVPFFAPAKTELQITASNNGDFFCAHQDNAHAGECRTRALTFVYYVNPRPSAFEGGRLLLYPQGKREGAENEVVAISPTSNTVVFFPSGVLHEIEPIVCRTGAFGDSRFTVNGWFHDADNAETVAAS